MEIKIISESHTTQPSIIQSPVEISEEKLSKNAQKRKLKEEYYLTHIDEFKQKRKDKRKANNERKKLRDPSTYTPKLKHTHQTPIDVTIAIDLSFNSLMNKKVK